MEQRRHSKSKGFKPDFCATAEPCLTVIYTENANGPNICIPREFSDPSFFFFFLIFKFLNRFGKQVLITTTSYLSLIFHVEEEEVAVQRS